MSILPKAIYIFNTNPTKIPMTYSQNYNKYFKNLYGTKKAPHSNSNPEKEQSWRKLSPYYETTLSGHSNQNSIVIKNSNNNRHIDQWNRVESPEINPYLYSQLIYNRGSKHIQCAAAPGPAPARSAAGFLGENRVKGSLPCQTRFEQHGERPCCLKSQGGNNDEVTNTQGLCVPTETADASWGDLGVGGP